MALIIIITTVIPLFCSRYTAYRIHVTFPNLSTLFPNFSVRSPFCRTKRHADIFSINGYCLQRDSQNRNLVEQVTASRWTLPGNLSHRDRCLFCVLNPQHEPPKKAILRRLSDLKIHRPRPDLNGRISNIMVKHGKQKNPWERLIISSP